MNRSITEKRFFNNILKTENGCWEWQASKTRFGYGKFKSFNQQLAHRVSYILHYGTLDKDICVLHKCDNPPCVNPEHLFTGSIEDNNKDRASKGRTVVYNTFKTHCKRGHEFNEKNTYIRKSGRRMCRVCEKLRIRNSRR